MTGTASNKETAKQECKAILDYLREHGDCHATSIAEDLQIPYGNISGRISAMRNSARITFEDWLFRFTKTCNELHMTWEKVEHEENYLALYEDEQDPEGVALDIYLWNQGEGNREYYVKHRADPDGWAKKKAEQERPGWWIECDEDGWGSLCLSGPLEVYWCSPLVPPVVTAALRSMLAPEREVKS